MPETNRRTGKSFFADLPPVPEGSEKSFFADLGYEEVPVDEPAPAPASEEDVDPEWGDYGRMVMSGGAGLVEGQARVVQRSPAVNVSSMFGPLGGMASLIQPLLPVVAPGVEKAAGEARKSWISTNGVTPDKLSPQAQKALQTDFLGEGKFGDKWDHAKLLAANSLLGTAGGMGAGGVFTRVLTGLGMRSGKAAAAIGYGAGEAAVAAPAAGAQTQSRVEQMTHDQLMQSPEYQAAYAGFERLPEAERQAKAKKLVADAAANDAEALTLLSTFVLSSPFSQTVGRAAGAVPGAKSRIGGAGIGAVEEPVQEFGQSGAEQMASNLAVQRNADPSQSITEGALEQAVGGAMSGVPLGAAAGMASPPGREAAKPPPDPNRPKTALEDIQDLAGQPPPPPAVQAGAVETAAEEARQRMAERGGDKLDQEVAAALASAMASSEKRAAMDAETRRLEVKEKILADRQAYDDAKWGKQPLPADVPATAEAAFGQLQAEQPPIDKTATEQQAYAQRTEQQLQQAAYEPGSEPAQPTLADAAPQVFKTLQERRNAQGRSSAVEQTTDNRQAVGSTPTAPTTLQARRSAAPIAPNGAARSAEQPKLLPAPKVAQIEVTPEGVARPVTETEISQRQPTGTLTLGKRRLRNATPIIVEKTKEQIDEAAHQAATSPKNELPEPTEAQKESGNYSKGHVKINGLDISIENPKGSLRTFRQPNGEKGERRMRDHYGYIRRTEGADGDQVDVFVGDQPDSPTVYVIDQLKPDGSFDEHKSMLGFPNRLAAIRAYKRNYQSGWKVGPITEMPVEEFKTWVREGDTKKPLKPNEIAQPSTEEAVRERAARKGESVRFSEESETGQVIERTEGGEIEAQAGQKYLQVKRAYLTPSVRGQRRAVALMLKLADHAKQRGLTLASDVSVSPEAERVYDALGRRGYRIQRNPADRSPKTGNLVSRDPRVPAIEVHAQSAVSAPRSSDARTDDAPAAAQRQRTAVAAAQKSLKEIEDPDEFLRQFDLSRLSDKQRAALDQYTAAKTEGDVLELFQSSEFKQNFLSVGDVIRAPYDFVVYRGAYATENLNERDASGIVTPTTLRRRWAETLAEARWANPGIQRILIRKGDPIIPIVTGDLAESEIILPTTARYALSAETSYDADTSPYIRADGTRALDDYVVRDWSAAATENPSAQLDAAPAKIMPLKGQKNTAVAAVRKALKPFFEEFGADAVTVLDSPEQLPEQGRRLLQERGKMRVRGVYFPPSFGGEIGGKAYVFAANAETPQRAVMTAIHEYVGHKGIRVLLGDKYEATMLDIYESIEDMDWVKDFLAHHRLDVLDATARKVIAADEFIASVAQAGKTSTVLQKAVAAIRAALRKFGFVKQWTEGDILRLVRRSRSALLDHSAIAQRAQPLQSPVFSEDEPLSVASPFGATKEAQANYNPGFVRSRLDALRDVGRNSIHIALDLVQRDALPDFGSPGSMPTTSEFIDEARAQDGRKNELLTEADDEAKKWAWWAMRHRKQNKRLMDLMHAATLAGVDPSNPYVARYAGGKKGKLTAQQEQTERQRREQWARLKKHWDSLSQGAQKIFERVRDLYKLRRIEAENALIDRITQAEADGKVKEALTLELRTQFEAGRVLDPYFPLARWGKYFASAKDKDGEVYYSRFENTAERDAWVVQARKLGLAEVKLGEGTDSRAVAKQINSDFVVRVTALAKDIDPELADEIWQMYLRSLPEMSMRKHFQHRKGVLGFSGDALRAFGYQMFHTAHQLARLEHGYKLERVLKRMEKEAEAISGDAKHPDHKWAKPLYDEFVARYEWMRNPRSAPWVAPLTSFGFLWYLGSTFAVGAINLLQTPILAFPTLAARFNTLGAQKELSRAIWQYSTHWGPMANSLSGDERQAMIEARKRGLFERTQAHDLAGIGNEGIKHTGAYNRSMKVASWLFHKTEEANRQVTFIAGYRLARKAGRGHEAAVKESDELTRLAHFTYDNENRAPLMQNDFMKVFFLFKQYGMAMTYRVARDFSDSIRRLPSPRRREARRRFAGTMAMVWMFSGFQGLPGAWAVEAVMNAIFEDDDEPFDFSEEARAYLQEEWGESVATAVMKGPAQAATGIALSGRVGLNGVIIREVPDNLEGAQRGLHLLKEAAGPVASIGVNVFDATMLEEQGYDDRAIEKVMPKAVTDQLKMLRYLRKGVTSKRGDELIGPDDVSAWDLALQGAGFASNKIESQYAQNRFTANYGQKIEDRRAALLNRYFLAARNGDEKALAKVWDEIGAFSQKYPTRRIGPKEIVQSAKARARYSSEAVDGLRLPRGLRFLHDETRFLDDEEETEE